MQFPQPIQLSSSLSLEPTGTFRGPFFLIFIENETHMQETTYDTDSFLAAVNSVLGAIGQAPVQRLEYKNPEISFVANIVKEVNNDVQNEGWVFNREDCVEFLPSGINKTIPIPESILRLDISEGQVYRTTDVVRRQGKLYDKLRHSFEFPAAIKCDVVYLLPFEDLPNVFKRYITYRASVRAANQLTSNPQLAQLLASQEAYSRAACMEYECNQGDYTFFGTPPGTSYRSYQPYRTLAR